MWTSFKKRLETFSKPSQIYKLKELFKPTLVPFTLWLAIGAFATSMLLDFDAENVKWIFAVVFRMEIAEHVADLVHFGIIVLFGIIFACSFLIIVTMIASWTALNTIRLVVSVVTSIRRVLKKLKTKKGKTKNERD